MRVIIVTQTFPPRFGGMQSVMSALAKNFSKTIPTFVLPDHHIPDSHPIRSCLLYTSPSPRDPKTSRMPSSA